MRSDNQTKIKSAYKTGVKSEGRTENIWSAIDVLLQAMIKMMDKIHNAAYAVKQSMHAYQENDAISRMQYK